MPSMAKIGGKGFAYGEEIDRGLNDFMSTLKKNNYFKGLDRNTFTDKAADAFSYLNEIHPFREGNGRTQRSFFTALAHNAGHNLDFSVISAERMRSICGISIAIRPEDGADDVIGRMNRLSAPLCRLKQQPERQVVISGLLFPLSDPASARDNHNAIYRRLQV